MKILLVNKFHYRRGGAETYYFTLAEALQKAGHTVIFFSMKDEKNIDCEQKDFFVENREYIKKTSIIKKIKAWKNFVYSKEAYKKISLLIEKEKPDIAILNNIHRQLTTSIVDALYNHKIKIYWVIHDLILMCPNYQMLDSYGNICEDCCNGNYLNCIKKKCIKNSRLKSFLGYREAKYNLKNKTYNKIDIFITPSKFYKEKMIKYGFDEKKIVYIPNPLSFDFTYEINDDNENYILYMGRISREKGIKTLIDAMKNINYDLYILGTGPLEEDLKNYSKNFSNIKFLGFKTGNELINYVRKCRCVVLPSEWYENGPYSAMESMGLGKPLIVSNQGGLPELVSNGINGYVYSNKQELEECILKVISVENYSDLCRNSNKMAKEMFNANYYLERIGIE